MIDDSPVSMTPVALVTGAAKRVGKVVAERLSAAGYRVVLHSNHSREEAEAVADRLRASGSEAAVVTADLSDEDQTRQMAADAWQQFGRIDALVNCAAIWKPKPLEEVRAADVLEHFTINTLGTFLCCQEIGLRMVEQESGGAIVTVGDWAIARPYIDYAAYFPSKGAIPTLTRMLAVELARRNSRVRVNCILPGPVLLPPGISAEAKRKVIDLTLVKREGSPEYVAHAVLFLLENDFVTGVTLPVDGGRSIFSGHFEHGS